MSSLCRARARQHKLRTSVPVRGELSIHDARADSWADNVENVPNIHAVQTSELPLFAPNHTASDWFSLEGPVPVHAPQTQECTDAWFTPFVPVIHPGTGETFGFESGEVAGFSDPFNELLNPSMMDTTFWSDSGSSSPYLSSTDQIHLTEIDHSLYPQNHFDFMDASYAEFIQDSPVEVKTPVPRNIAPKRFCCPIPGCTKAFTRKYNMNSHIRCHSGERPFLCPHCENASFARSHDLRRHIACLHKEDRPFKCNHCTLRFNRSDALKRHIETVKRRT
ncbi:hypothetical protein DFS34DRAFT_40275 [Phlyctochytrium arcticum]|nr:hypothetical protein DFS34DRAFT_40275 [Phlyctochytrium arcticum]